MKTREKKIFAAILILFGVIFLITTFGVVKKKYKVIKDSRAEKIKAYRHLIQKHKIAYKIGHGRVETWATVTGKVVDHNNQPIQSATVTIESLPDNIKLQRERTNRDGGFKVMVLESTQIPINEALNKFSGAQALVCLLSVTKNDPDKHYVTAQRRIILVKDETVNAGTIPLGEYRQLKKDMGGGRREPAFLTDRNGSITAGGTYYLINNEGTDGEEIILKMKIPNNSLVSITEETYDNPVPLMAMLPDPNSAKPYGWQYSVPLPPRSQPTYFADIYPDMEFRVINPESETRNEWPEIYFKNDLGFAPGTEIPVGIFENGWWNDISVLLDTDEQEVDDIKGYQPQAVVTSDGNWIMFKTIKCSPPDINTNQAIVSAGNAVASNSSSGGGNDPGGYPMECGDYGLGSIISLRDGHYSIKKHLKTWKVADSVHSLALCYSTRHIRPRFIISFLSRIESIKSKLIESISDWISYGIDTGDIGGYRLKFDLDYGNGKISSFINLDQDINEEIVDNDLAEDLEIKLDDREWLLNFLLDNTNKKFKKGVNRLVITRGLNGIIPHWKGDRFAGVATGIINNVRSRDYFTLLGDIYKRFLRIFYLDTTDSVFGAGWTLNVEDKIIKDNDGSVIIFTGEQVPIHYIPCGPCEPFEYLKDSSTKFVQTAVDERNGDIYVGTSGGKIMKVINNEDSRSLEEIERVAPPIRAMRAAGGYLYISHLTGVVRIPFNGEKQIVHTAAGITGIDIGEDGNIYMIQKIDIGENIFNCKILKKPIDGTGRAREVCTLPVRIKDPWALAVSSDGSLFYVACRFTSRLYEVRESGAIESIMYKSDFTLRDAFELINNLYYLYLWAAINEYTYGVQDVIRINDQLFLVDARNGAIVKKNLVQDTDWEIVSKDPRFDPDTGIPLTGIAPVYKDGNLSLVASAGYLLGDYEKIGSMVTESALFKLGLNRNYYRCPSTIMKGSYIEKGNLNVPDNIIWYEDSRDINNIRENGWCQYDLTGNRKIFDESGHLVALLNSNGIATLRFVYTEALLRKIIDRTGNIVNLNYNHLEGKSILSSITYNNLGSGSTFTIQNGNLIQVKNPGESFGVEYGYNDVHLMTSVTNQQNHTKTIHFGRFGFVDRITYDNGEEREFVYGLRDDLLNDIGSGQERENPLNLHKGLNIYSKYISGEGIEYTTVFDLNGAPLLELNPRGMKTFYIRDKGNVIKAIIRAVRETESGVTTRKRQARFLQYENRHNLLSKVLEISSVKTSGEIANRSLTAFDFKYKNYEYQEDNAKFMVRLFKITKVGTDGEESVGEWLLNCVPNTFRDKLSETTGWIKQIFASIGDMLGKITPETFTQYQWDADGNPSVLSHSNGAMLEYDVNDRGQITMITDSYGNKVSYEYYDSNWNVQNVVLGALEQRDYVPMFTFEYDNLGNVTKLTHPTGSIVEWAYNETLVTDYTFYNTDNFPVTSTYLYDELDGDCESCEDSAKLGLLSQITNSKYDISQFYYNETGLMNGMQDFENNITNFSYNLDEQVTSIQKPLGDEITFSYDNNDGNLITISVPSGGLSAVDYARTADGLGLTKTITYPDDEGTYKIERNFQSDSLIIKHEYRDGDWIKFERDDLGRIYESSNKEIHNAGIKLSYNYDDIGQLVNVSSNDYTNLEYSYDLSGRLTGAKSYNDTGALISEIIYQYVRGSFDWWNRDSITQDFMGTSITTDYTYDDTKYNCLLKGFNIGSPIDCSVEYDYYDNSWLETVHYNDERIATFTYEYPSDDYLYKLIIRYGNGLYRISGFNSNGDITLLNPLSSYSDGSRSDLTYEYDSNRNIDLIKKDGSEIIDYNYDNANRLIDVLIADHPERNESYSYNKFGERTGSHFQADGTFVYDKGQLTQYQYSDTGELVSLTYDDIGNLKTKTVGDKTMNLEWNNRNQLIRAYSDDFDVSYSYDGLGRRILKEFSDGRKEKYIYKGDNIWAVLNENNELVSTIIHGPTIDSPLVMILPDGAYFYYHADSRGTITKITYNDGNWLGDIEYDSFGRIYRTHSSNYPEHEDAFNKFLDTPPKYRFIGREYDTETGLIYCRDRYLDPETGRFISRDPIRLKSRLSTSNFINGAYDFDEYNYCANNPIKFFDPNGSAAVLPHMISGYLIAGAIGGYVTVLGINATCPNEDWLWDLANSYNDFMESLAGPVRDFMGDHPIRDRRQDISDAGKDFYDSHLREPRVEPEPWRAREPREEPKPWKSGRSEKGERGLNDIQPNDTFEDMNRGGNPGQPGYDPEKGPSRNWLDKFKKLLDLKEIIDDWLKNPNYPHNQK